jgi:futalosine hydrolase
LIKQSGLKAVNAVSVNQITTSKQMIESYISKFDPVVESMEGAALHYVCLQEKIPFLQLRSISNYIGERDKKKWKIKDAILNLNLNLNLQL